MSGKFERHEKIDATQKASDSESDPFSEARAVAFGQPQKSDKEPEKGEVTDKYLSTTAPFKPNAGALMPNGQISEPLPNGSTYVHGNGVAPDRVITADGKVVKMQRGPNGELVTPPKPSNITSKRN